MNKAERDVWRELNNLAGQIQGYAQRVLRAWTYDERDQVVECLDRIDSTVGVLRTLTALSAGEDGR